MHAHTPLGNLLLGIFEDTQAQTRLQMDTPTFSTLLEVSEAEVGGLISGCVALSDALAQRMQRALPSIMAATWLAMQTK